MINNGEVAGPTSAMSGRRVDFGKAGESDGLAWGIEVDIDISDPLIKARFQEMKFQLPTHIKYVKFLELAPQEALPPPQRTVGSSVPQDSWRGGSALIKIASPEKYTNDIFDKIIKGLNLLTPKDGLRFKTLRGMISYVFAPSMMSDWTGSKQFDQILKESKGNTLVIVHGHSNNLSTMGEQYQDEVRNEDGRILQKKGNRVSINDILSRYDNPDKYSAIVLNGCNHKKGVVEAKKVPVFYPMGYVPYDSERQEIIGRQYDIGLALPQEPTS